MLYGEWTIAHEEALKEENEELIGALEDIFWDYNGIYALICELEREEVNLNHTCEEFVED